MRVVVTGPWARVYDLLIFLARSERANAAPHDSDQ